MDDADWEGPAPQGRALRGGGRLAISGVRLSQILMYGLALALMAGVMALLFSDIEGLLQEQRAVIHTHRVLERVDAVRLLLTELQSDVRGFVASGDEHFLEFYYPARRQLAEELAKLAQLSVDDPGQQARISALRAQAAAFTAYADKLVDLRRSGGAGAARPKLSHEHGADLINRVGAMSAAEHDRLDRRAAAQQRATRNTLVAAIVGGTLSIILLLVVFLRTVQEMRRRQDAEARLTRSRTALRSNLEHLTRLTQELEASARLAELLQGCRSEEEAYAVLVRTAPSLLSGASGGVYLINNSHTLVEQCAAWGAEGASEALFPSEDCWALRRGVQYAVEDVQKGVSCKHAAALSAGACVCQPLSAQGELLGVLFVHSPAAGVFTEGSLRLVHSVGEHLGLALANIRLQERLRMQSIVDPLSGLFNRRYMETVLELELTRARRQHRPVSLIILDIDHFKRCNDTYGHEAGDMVIAAIGGYLKSAIRGGDVACRFGGEEFVLILPEAPLALAGSRADELREGLAAIRIEHRGQTLQSVTASFGVAAYPEHGHEPNDLLRIADQALYQAKQSGRDRVVVARVPPAAAQGAGPSGAAGT